MSGRDAELDYMGVSPLTPDGTSWSLGHNGSLTLVGNLTEYLGKSTVVVLLEIDTTSRLYERINLSSVLGFDITDTDQPGAYMLEYEVALSIAVIQQVVSSLETAAAVLRGRFQEAWENLDYSEEPSYFMFERTHDYGTRIRVMNEKGLVQVIPLLD